jgi:hypothetical protein
MYWFHCILLCRLIRLEFNCVHCDYYTELDAVRLTGKLVEDIPHSDTHGDCNHSIPDPNYRVTDKSMCCAICDRNNDTKINFEDIISGNVNSTDLFNVQNLEMTPRNSPCCCKSSTDNSLCARGGNVFHVGSSTNYPTERITQGIAQLHLLDGLSAALDVSNNGYFDQLPVGIFPKFII